MVGAVVLERVCLVEATFLRRRRKNENSFD